MVVFGLFLLSAVLAGIFQAYCAEQAKANGGEKRIRFAIAILAAILLAIWGWFFGVYRSEESVAARVQERAEQRAETECNSKTSAFLISQQFVEDRLKSPSSADYASMSQSKVENLGQCKFLVSSYVDASNSYGAMMRTRYLAIVEYIPSADRWKLHSIEM